MSNAQHSFLMFCIVFNFFCAGITIGRFLGKEQVQKEATARGYGEIYVDDKGESKWRWRENKKREQP